SAPQQHAGGQRKYGDHSVDDRSADLFERRHLSKTPTLGRSAILKRRHELSHGASDDVGARARQPLATDFAALPHTQQGGAHGAFKLTVLTLHLLAQLTLFPDFNIV